MNKDILFLLAPEFEDAGRREFCQECAEIWGILNYFPALKAALDIRYEQLDHPRAGLVTVLGAGKWGCPTLVLGHENEIVPDTDVKTANGMRFLDNTRDIATYFAHTYATPFPR